ncbi:MAG: M23 family metallopeptidase [Cyanobacteriota bacterium]|nr:M23 family metallopeptidase [Cyanobacteriota bacterium]
MLCGVLGAFYLATQGFAASTQQLQAQLQQAVGQQQWQASIDLVDQMIRAYPPRQRGSLQNYREKLRALLDPEVWRGYQLPFPRRQCHPVLQGNHGSYSHYLPSNRYAWDFGMQRGSLITAAAAGQIGVIESNRGDGMAIVIDHTPQVRTLYGHLSSVTVKRHQAVRAGQVIGRSGVSRNGVPHLHYSVITHHPMRSLPSSFLDVAGETGVPQAGYRYCADR